MKFSEYSFVDEESKRVDHEVLKRDYPEIAEVMLFEGLTNSFFVTLDAVEFGEEESEDYSEDIEHFNKLFEVMSDYLYVIKPNKTSILPILNAMENLINRENLGKVLVSMDYRERSKMMLDIREKINTATQLKYAELSDTDKDAYYSLRSELAPVCATPYYNLKKSELKVNINKNGIIVNNKKLDIDYNTAQSKKREIFEEFDIDNVMKELGITSPIQRVLAKRKIDPAILFAIKESDFKGPVLELFKRSVSDRYLNNMNIEELKNKTAKQYIAAVLGKEVEEDKENAFSIEYNVNQIDNPVMKRNARRAKGLKNMIVIGDVRSKLQVLRDQIFGRKIDEADVDIIENYNSSESDNKITEGVSEEAKVVETFTLDLDKAQAAALETPNKADEDVTHDDQTSGEEK